MIPELKVLGEIKEPKRIRIQDVTEKRLDSLREAVIDFCRRSMSLAQAMHLWAYISRILSGKEEAELWWIVNGNTVEAFLIMKTYQDFDGQWTAYTLYGWSKSIESRSAYRFILDDYIEKGITRFQFVTRRNAKVFQRWAGKNWAPVATTFELRR